MPLAVALLVLAAISIAPSALGKTNEGAIAFSSTRDGNAEAYVLDPSARDMIRLTNVSSIDQDPAISPDGKSIAFASSRNGDLDIYVLQIADPAAVTRVVQNTSADANPAWSPDGKKLAFVSNRRGNKDIHVVDLGVRGGTSGLIDGNSAEDDHPAWSPDGKQIAFASKRTSKWQVYVAPANGGPPTRLGTGKANDTQPVWSPQGQLIAFASDRGGAYEIYTMKPDGTDVKQITRSKLAAQHPSWSPDGKRIAFEGKGSASSYGPYVIDASGANLLAITVAQSPIETPHWGPAILPTTNSVGITTRLGPSTPAGAATRNLPGIQSPAPATALPALGAPQPFLRFIAFAFNDALFGGGADQRSRTVISGDGRYISFASGDQTLVHNETFSGAQVFLQDRQSGQVVRVSKPSTVGCYVNKGGAFPSISDDARYVVFSAVTARSRDLPSDQCNVGYEYLGNELGIFLHDRLNQSTILIARRLGGYTIGLEYRETAQISADGRFVVLALKQSGGAGNVLDVYNIQAQQWTTLTTDAVGVGSISGSGRYIAYAMTDVLQGDSNGVADIFVRDMETGSATRVTNGMDGQQSNGRSHVPAISRDGRYVAFISQASNLVPGDTNGADDIFVWDRQTGATERVSLAADGSQGAAVQGAGDNPFFPPHISLSDDGRYVAFNLSTATFANDRAFPVHSYVRDRTAGTTTVIQTPVQGGFPPSGLYPNLSGDGKLVVFNIIHDPSNNAGFTRTDVLLSSNPLPLSPAAVGGGGSQAASPRARFWITGVNFTPGAKIPMGGIKCAGTPVNVDWLAPVDDSGSFRTNFDLPLPGVKSTDRYYCAATDSTGKSSVIPVLFSIEFQFQTAVSPFPDVSNMTGKFSGSGFLPGSTLANVRLRCGDAVLNLGAVDVSVTGTFEVSFGQFQYNNACYKGFEMFGRTYEFPIP